MKTIEINLTNRMLIGIVTIVAILSLVLGVYAYTGPIPDPGHGVDNLTVTIGGVPTNLQTALNQEVQFSLVCATYSMGLSGDPVFVGSSDGTTYSVSEVVERFQTTRLRCKQENGWAMTGLSTREDNTHYHDDEVIFVNEGSVHVGQDYDAINIRCCKVF